MSTLEKIEITPYVKIGNMLYNRNSLGPKHPENLYNYIKNTFNVKPEDYGIQNPIVEMNKQRFGDKTREELIEMILDLEEVIEGVF